MKYLFLILLCCFAVGCATVSDNWALNNETGELELISRLTCKGSGCKADHKNRKIEGDTFVPKIPDIPIQVEQ